MGALVSRGSHGRGGDPIALAEAARAPAHDTPEWLDGVVDAARTLLDQGLGAVGWIANLRGRGGTDALSLRGTPRGYRGLVVETLARARELPIRAFDRGCLTLSDELGAGLTSHPWVMRYRRLGQRDAFGISHSTPDGRGILLSVPLREVRTTTAAERRRWLRLMAHVAAGLRAREGSPAAILRADGRVEHAERGARLPQVRSALREATVRSERARGRMRRDDPDGALELWSAMVLGEYSLVDHFESDGRRYVVARRCSISSPASPGLTARELVVAAHSASGRPLKLIAYELGLSISTVATHLGRAMQKLGVASRSELAAALGPLATGAD